MKIIYVNYIIFKLRFESRFRSGICIVMGLKKGKRTTASV